ncbi:MAG TPA: ATP-binding protein [Myxococcaceae bacterium]|nr:ATP-binding protein [Myxococcaceae bacterium]
MVELTTEVLATLFDESPEPVFVFTPVREGGRVVDFRYLYANPVAARMVGTTPVSRFVPGLGAGAKDAERSGVLGSYCRTLETGEPTERRVQDDSGPLKRWLRIHATRAGSALVVRLRDVTRETETHAALAASEAERDRTEVRRAGLESLLAQVPAEMAYLRGPDLVYEFVNDRYRARHPGREFLGLTLTEALPEWRAEPLLQAMRGVLHTGIAHRDQEHPLMVETPGGSERRWFDLAFLPVTGADGAVEGVLSFATDVTEQVSARARSDALARERMALADELEGERRRLALGEERFRSIVETNADMVWVADWNGHNRHVVPAWCALTGQRPEEMLGLGWIDVVHPDDLERTARLWAEAVAQRRRFYAEYRVHKASGGWATVASRGIPLLRADGKIREWVGTTIDVTTRHREEEALRILSGGAAELSGTLDYEATLRAVGEMAIPTFADVCIVDLVEDSGSLRRVLVSGNIEEEALTELRAMAPRTDADSPVTEALRTGRSVLRERVPAAVKLEMAADPERLRLFERLSPTSLVCAPLSARGRTLGVISFLTVRSGRRFDRLDLGLVEELARRAALAMVNAELYQRAEEASRAKDEFLATVSHELRTPLASILGWTRLLRRGGLSPEKQIRALETLERNAKAQTRLVEDLLDVSRIVSGKTRLDLETVDLGRVVEAAVESLRPSAESRGVQLVSSIAPCTLTGDPERLHQILFNLLSNSMKFTPRGGRVSVSLAVCDGAATLTVSDTGQGIRADFLPHVFERFRQADTTVTRAHGGLGLGLAIVRHLVELHGGTVAASSAGEGHGSTFIVQLPLTRALAAERTARTVEVAGTPERVSLSGLRLLVVDDEPDTLEMLASTLEGHGAEVVTLGDAERALAWLASNRADALISDIAMPRMDGCALIREIRRMRSGSTAGMPAVALSAFARPEDRSRALEAGFQDYLTKPVEPEVLVARVGSLARPRVAA